MKIPILMYHSIECMPKSTVMRSLHVSPKKFRFQMWLLNFFGYQGLSISKLEPYLKGEKVGKVVGITFDDGYQNNLLNAAPILNKYNFSSTCYIVSKRIGMSNSWDKSKGITQRPLMNIQDVKKWIDMGMDIGAHTLTHADLSVLDNDAIKLEINQCKFELEKLFKVKIQDFCYPYGRFNNEIAKLVNQAGFITATTMIRGRVEENSNMLKLPRIPITHHTLPHLFLTKIFTRYEDKRQG